MKAETWIKMALHPEEISQTPYDIVKEMSEEESELRRQNDQLQDTLEKKRKKCTKH